MLESRTFTLPKEMTLVDRISKVSTQIFKWLSSLEEPFNVERDRLQLTKSEQDSRGYVYQYTMAICEDLSASDVSKDKGGVM